MNKLIAGGVLMGCSVLAFADITGLWQTVDDESGDPKSIVEIHASGENYVGTVRDLLSRSDDAICNECEGDLKGERIVGMEILTGLEQDGDAYTGGKILDPANGKVYRAKLWLEDEQTLKVRGYLGPFYRTQTWQRVTD